MTLLETAIEKPHCYFIRNKEKIPKNNPLLLVTEKKKLSTKC